jgi:hypothetical protein
MTEASRYVGHAGHAAGLASSAVLTALFDELIARHSLRREDVLSILDRAQESLGSAADSTSTSVGDAMDTIQAIEKRFRE